MQQSLFADKIQKIEALILSYLVGMAAYCNVLKINCYEGEAR